MAFSSGRVYKSRMRSGTYRTGGFLTAKLLFALLGIVAFLAQATPGPAHNLAAFFADGDLAYEVPTGDDALVPKLDRDERQRLSSSVPPIGENFPFAAGLLLLPGRSTVASALLPDRALRRFYHLDERTSPSRAPPLGA